MNYRDGARREFAAAGAGALRWRPMPPKSIDGPSAAMRCGLIRKAQPKKRTWI